MASFRGLGGSQMASDRSLESLRDHTPFRLYDGKAVSMALCQHPQVVALEAIIAAMPAPAAPRSLPSIRVLHIAADDQISFEVVLSNFRDCTTNGQRVLAALPWLKLQQLSGVKICTTNCVPRAFYGTTLSQPIEQKQT